jgi:hypothetical protein
VFANLSAAIDAGVLSVLVVEPLLRRASSMATARTPIPLRSLRGWLARRLGRYKGGRDCTSGRHIRVSGCQITGGLRLSASMPTSLTIPAEAVYSTTAGYISRTCLCGDSSTWYRGVL